VTRNGIVVEVSGDRALVSLSDSAECSSCAAKHACYGLSGKKGLEINSWVRNDAGARAGDRVELELEPATSMLVIFITFLMPVMLLAGGYLLMSGRGEPVRAAGAGVGLFLGILLAVLVNRKLARRQGCEMRIIAVT
jgi:positive regulator of sigma E activity